MTLGDYISFKTKQFERGVPDSHLNHLMAKENDQSFEHVRDMVERGTVYLIATRQMEQGLRRLQGDFPDLLTDVMLGFENTSTPDQKVTDSHRAQIQEICSPYCRKLLDLAQSSLPAD